MSASTFVARITPPRFVGAVPLILAIWLCLYEVGVIYELVLYPYSLAPAVVLLVLGVILQLTRAAAPVHPEKDGVAR